MRVAKVDVTFRSGHAPVEDLEGPSASYLAGRTALGAERIHRWFHREWAPLG